MAACTKAVRRRRACQACARAEEIHQRHHAQRLEASTPGWADVHECRRVSTAVVGEWPRGGEESGLSGQVLAFQGKRLQRKVSTTVDTNCPPGSGQASQRQAPLHVCRSCVRDNKPAGIQIPYRNRGDQPGPGLYRFSLSGGEPARLSVGEECISPTFRGGARLVYTIGGTSTEPEVAGANRRIVRPSVVLPQSLSPTMPRVSPA